MLYIESSLLIDIFKNISIDKIRKIGTFFKGYSRCFCSKFLKYLYFFFLDQAGQENVLSAFLDLGYTMILGQNVYFK